MNFRQKIAKFITSDAKSDVNIQGTELKNKKEALDVLKITIEEYQDLIRRRTGRAVKVKKQPTEQIIVQGPLEEFLSRIREKYKSRKLAEKNDFKFTNIKEHYKSAKLLADFGEFCEASLYLFYADYVSKNGVKKRPAEIAGPSDN